MNKSTGGNMKRVLSVLVVVGLVFIYACGGGGDDPKSVMKDFLDTFEGYIDGMAKVESADDLVAVTESAIAKFEKLAPRMKAVTEKYPELKKMRPGGRMPEQFKEFEDRMKELGTKMFSSMGKLMKFMNDPKVKEAQRKLQKAMSLAE